MHRAVFFATFCLLLHPNSPGQPSDQTRRVSTDGQLELWLQNMVWHHQYSDEEISNVTGLTSNELKTKLKLFNIFPATRPNRESGKIFVLPYPGGRHPRIGFLEGAIAPQRETKLSVFCPWDQTS